MPDPQSGAAPHTFTLPRRNPTPLHPEGVSCPYCEHGGMHDAGAAIAPGYTFTLAEAARCLILVGTGASLREASQTIRFAAGRFTHDRLGLRSASRQNALASDYLDQFGPVIVERVRPSHWPHIVVLASHPLDVHGPGVSADPLHRGRVILVALGAETAHTRLRMWLAAVASDETTRSWSDFLSRLAATPAPGWVVGSRVRAVKAAVGSTWPTAIFYPSERQLRLLARRRASADGLLERSGIGRLIDSCFASSADWRRLGEALWPFERSTTRDWWLRTDAEARRMIVLTSHHSSYPRDSGVAERIAGEIARRLGNRPRNFRNRRRLETIVELMAIDLAGSASEGRYREALREHLAAADWELRNDWEAGHDLYAEVPAVARPGAGATQRRRATRATSRVTAPPAPPNEVSSFVAQTSRANMAPGATPTTLADLPSLLLEWDGERNEVEDPGSIELSRRLKANWICAAGHRWQAWLQDRSRGLAPCRTCHRERVDSVTSVAALWPALVAEWDAAANGRKSPERTRATSRIAVGWRCLASPEHAAYRMSPAARISRLLRDIPGCAACRAGRMRQGGAQSGLEPAAPRMRKTGRSCQTNPEAVTVPSLQPHVPHNRTFPAPRP